MAVLKKLRKDMSNHTNYMEGRQIHNNTLGLIKSTRNSMETQKLTLIQIHVIVPVFAILVTAME
jgi:hypothetical protein